MSATILIVEDDEEESTILIECFKENNYHKVTSFDNAFTFINYLRNKDTLLPKVVILDYNMPQISGFQLLAFLKHNDAFASIQVLIYSGFNNDDLQIRCLKAGALDFIKKFSSPHELSEFVVKVKALAESGVYVK